MEEAWLQRRNAIVPHGAPEPDHHAPRRQSRQGEDVLVSAFAPRYLSELRARSARAAAAVAGQAVEDGLAVPTVHTMVIQPAMREIGSLWQRDVITVADEHLATAISNQVLSELFGRLLKRKPMSRESVVLAGTEGEHHVLGLRMIADVLEGAGFDVAYLGPDVPRNALLDFCRENAPDVVGLSASGAAPHTAVIAIAAPELRNARGVQDREAGGLQRRAGRVRRVDLAAPRSTCW